MKLAVIGTGALPLQFEGDGGPVLFREFHSVHLIFRSMEHPQEDGRSSSSDTWSIKTLNTPTYFDASGGSWFLDAPARMILYSCRRAFMMNRDNVNMKPLAAVFFEVDKELPLIGAGEE